MTDEFNIIDEKTPAEKKAEKITRNLERMIDADRLERLVREETADIDALIGILFQTRGFLQMRNSIADLVEDYINDMTSVATSMVHVMNDETSKKRRRKKDDE